jgi:soluble lytic murein transglycosylase
MRALTPKLASLAAALWLGFGALGAGAQPAQDLSAEAAAGSGVVPGFPEAIARSDHAMTDADKKAFSAAFDAIDARNWPRALKFAADIHHPLAAKIITWAYLTADETKPGFDELVTFANENSGWPLQETLLAKAERAIPESMPPARLIAWFAGQEPLTGEGMVRLGEALLATGETNYGAGWIARAWATTIFDGSTQRELFSAYGQYLKGQPTAVRMTLLLWSREVSQAQWLLAQMPEEGRRIAQARIALIEDASNARAIYNSLPAAAQSDHGALFDLVRYLRRRGNDDEARKTLLAIAHPEQLPFPDKWWIERNVQIRKAMDDKNFADAYSLAARSGLTHGNEFADAEWLAGWIALRFLNKPQSAYTHFATLDAGVTYPISQARAEYWMGRAAEAMGDKLKAAAAYKKAAQYPYTYYGQLGAESPLLSNQALALPGTPTVDKAKWDDFLDDELVKAIQLIKQVDEERYVRTLAYTLADRADGDAKLILLSELLWTLDHPAISLRIAKRASQKHILLTDYLFPVFQIPPYPGSGTPPEPALVLGLARQESEFNPRAVSAAGARGLMQILPSTARLTAQKHGLPFRRDRLLTDPAYNVQLGMAHLSDLTERFSGSYVLVIAAYNAGAGRINEWLGDLGDPRLPGTDPIDWIEAIPFSETRNYVQRVLENSLVYRSRIAGSPIPYTLTEELKRTSATPIDLSYTKKKSKAKTGKKPPPIEIVEPNAKDKPDSSVKPAPAPGDDGAAAQEPASEQAPSTPPSQKELDSAPGSAGPAVPAAGTKPLEDLPPSAAVPPDCKTFVVRPNGATQCIDQNDSPPAP